MIVKFFIYSEEVSAESLPYLPKKHDTVYFDSMEYTVGHSHIVTDLDNKDLLQYGCVDLELNFMEDVKKQKFSAGVDEWEAFEDSIKSNRKKKYYSKQPESEE